mmetsp:Transcript_5100/g.5616  ORF Transcript_5100/g.5616 Transcript_5100/m.5616 type:complete len:165 (-) Transcript_5100:273-767(-)
MKFIIFCLSLPLIFGGVMGYTDDYHMQKFENDFDAGNSAGINRMLRSNEVKTESFLQGEEDLLKEEEALLESILERGITFTGKYIGCINGNGSNGSNRKTFDDRNGITMNLRQRCFDHCGTQYIGIHRELGYSARYTASCFGNQPRLSDCNGDSTKIFKARDIM